jgi:urease accessory protein
MSESLPAARLVLPARSWSEAEAIGVVTLGWEDRRRRRARFAMDNGGRAFLLDLARPPRLRDGDGLALDDGVVRVRAAAEALLEVEPGATALARLAYHLGNRHAPVELGTDRLATPYDAALLELVTALGGRARRVERAFEPEPGAFEAHAR